MTKRKSQSKRLSGRKTGVLNEGSKIVDNDDTLRHDITHTRQSMSQNMLKHVTSILNEGPTVYSSQLSDEWYKHLSQTESSRLQADALKKKKRSEYADKTVEESESVDGTQSHSSNVFTKALEDTTNTSERTLGNRNTFIKPGPKFTKINKHGSNSFDRALDHARLKQINALKTTGDTGHRFVRFGDITLNDKIIEKLMNPWGPSSSRRAFESSSTVSAHSKYTIVESSTDSEDEIIVPEDHRRKIVEMIERTRAKKVKLTSKESIRGITRKENAHLSVFKGTAELGKSKEAESSKSLTSNLHSFTVQNGSKEASSNITSIKYVERDKLLDMESSDGETYTPTAPRAQRGKTDTNKKSKNSKSKPKRRLFREKKTAEPKDISDSMSIDESPATKDKSKDKKVKNTHRVSQRSQVTSQKNQLSSAAKRKSQESNAEESDGEKSGSTSTTERLQDLRRRLFENLNDGDGLDVNVDRFEGDLEFDNIPNNRSGSSRTSHKSTRKDHSTVRDTPSYESLSKNSRPTVPIVIEKKQRRSTLINSSSKPASSVSSDRRSVETSTDGTMITVSPRRTSTPMTSPVFSRRTSAAKPKKRNSAKSTHDSSHTPTNPGPSTLKLRGKRLTMFSSDTTDDKSDEGKASTAPHEDDDGLDLSKRTSQREKLKSRKRQRSRDDDRLGSRKKSLRTTSKRE